MQTHTIISIHSIFLYNSSSPCNVYMYFCVSAWIRPQFLFFAKESLVFVYNRHIAFSLVFLGRRSLCLAIEILVKLKWVMGGSGRQNPIREKGPVLRLISTSHNMPHHGSPHLGKRKSSSLPSSPSHWSLLRPSRPRSSSGFEPGHRASPSRAISLTGNRPRPSPRPAAKHASLVSVSARSSTSLAQRGRPSQTWFTFPLTWPCSTSAKPCIYLQQSPMSIWGHVYGQRLMIASSFWKTP